MPSHAQVRTDAGDFAETELARYTTAGVQQHVEAGLDDLRKAYAELHQEMAAAERPPAEQERIRLHVRAPCPLPPSPLYFSALRSHEPEVTGIMPLS